jgi:hypothetical protein
LSQGYTEEPEGRESTEQWEEIALIRQQIAVDLDLQAESKRTDAIKLESTRSYETAGDALDDAGDDKYSASDNYQKASKYWRKIAEAYKTAGEDIKREESPGYWRYNLGGCKAHASRGSEAPYDGCRAV